MAQLGLVGFSITTSVSYLIAACAVIMLLGLLHFISYSVLKNKIIERRRWGLNICCGKTDGGGVNADIVAHTELSNLVLVDVYNLPFRSQWFSTVLCSHTIEHVEDPAGFFAELKRVGRDVTIVIPPLWDLSAVFNVLEHRWIFLSFSKMHKTLPRYVRLPLASFIQGCLGQRVRA